MLISRIVGDVPDYKCFKTVEELNNDSIELARSSPDLVSLKRIGKSRNGEDIILLQIGKGSKEALLFACPHPNEPIGAMMLTYLSERLAGDKALREAFDFRWNIIKCIDPDGTKLNEPWFKGPFTPKNYAEKYYRPASYEQVEWTFPVDYKTLKFDNPLPETRALMNVIEEFRPDFMYSLHNSGFGGAFFYISKEESELYDLFHDTVKRRDIPLHMGEAEAPFMKKYADAVFKIPTIRDNYDFIAENMDIDPAKVINMGASSFEFLSGYNKDAFGLVCEVPYFYDHKIEDQTEINISRREVLLESIKISSEIINKINSVLEKGEGLFQTQSPYLKAAKQLLLMYENNNRTRTAWAENSPGMEMKATIAHYFDGITIAKFYHLILIGMFIRHFDYEIENSSLRREKLRQLKVSKDILFDYFLSINESMEKELKYQQIPIKKLVEIQLESGMKIIQKM